MTQPIQPAVWSEAQQRFLADRALIVACAEAMGWRQDGPPLGFRIWAVDATTGKDVGWWDPLTDDAQAMALVKRFRIHVVTSANNPALHWCCCPDGGGWSDNPDLNRAIVESVAKLHAVGDTKYPEKP